MNQENLSKSNITKSYRDSTNIIQDAIRITSEILEQDVYETADNIDSSVSVIFNDCSVCFVFSKLEDDGLSLVVKFDEFVIFSEDYTNIDEYRDRLQNYYDEDGLKLDCTPIFDNRVVHYNLRCDIFDFVKFGIEIQLPLSLLMLEMFVKTISILKPFEISEISSSPYTFKFFSNLINIKIKYIDDDSSIRAIGYVYDSLECTFDRRFSDSESFAEFLVSIVNYYKHEDDEEDVIDTGKFSDLNKNIQNESIVPDGITSITLVALKFDGVVVAYRFKTDKGYFDITRAEALKHGVSGFKIEKAIQLERFNGMLVTKSEIKNKRCIPDISGSDEDCKKLFDALFSY